MKASLFSASQSILDFLYSALLLMGLLYAAAVFVAVVLMGVGVAVVLLPAVWAVCEVIKHQDEQMEGY